MKKLSFQMIFFTDITLSTFILREYIMPEDYALFSQFVHVLMVFGRIQRIKYSISALFFQTWNDNPI